MECVGAGAKHPIDYRRTEDICGEALCPVAQGQGCAQADQCSSMASSMTEPEEQMIVNGALNHESAAPSVLWTWHGLASVTVHCCVLPAIPWYIGVFHPNICLVTWPQRERRICCMHYCSNVDTQEEAGKSGLDLTRKSESIDHV